MPLCPECKGNTMTTKAALEDAGTPIEKTCDECGETYTAYVK